jgi:hypothetical protein
MQHEGMKSDVGNHNKRGRVSRVIASVLALGATVRGVGVVQAVADYGNYRLDLVAKNF